MLVPTTLVRLFPCVNVPVMVTFNLAPLDVAGLITDMIPCRTVGLVLFAPLAPLKARLALNGTGSFCSWTGTGDEAAMFSAGDGGGYETVHSWYWSVPGYIDTYEYVGPSVFGDMTGCGASSVRRVGDYYPDAMVPEGPETPPGDVPS